MSGAGTLGAMRLALVNHFKGTQVLTPPEPALAQVLNLKDIKGQETAKRALEVTAGPRPESAPIVVEIPRYTFNELHRIGDVERRHVRNHEMRIETASSAELRSKGLGIRFVR